MRRGVELLPTQIHAGIGLLAAPAGHVDLQWDRSRRAGDAVNLILD